MKLPRIASRLVVIWSALAASGASVASDISSYSVVKLHRFGQAAGGEPVVDTRAYGGQFRVVPGLLVDDVQVLNSRPVEVPLNIEDEEASYEVTTKTLNAINVAFPPGPFQFTIATEIDGVVVATLNLPDQEFPAAPRISNLPALQQVAIDAPIPINWDAFGAQVPDDIIEFRLFDAGGVLVFTSGTLADDPHLDGTATGTEIPAGVLLTGSSYQGDLRFLHVVDHNTADYPGAVGLAALASETFFTLTTASGAQGTPQIDTIQRLTDGKVEIHFHGQAGLTYRVDYSPDFQQWNKLTDAVAAADGSGVAQDPSSDELARFYRVVGP